MKKLGTPAGMFVTPPSFTGHHGNDKRVLDKDTGDARSLPDSSSFTVPAVAWRLCVACAAFERVSVLSYTLQLTLPSLARP